MLSTGSEGGAVGVCFCAYIHVVAKRNNIADERSFFME
jgi:hypothetical protein